MHKILEGKKVIFFDVGNTLDYPASGDWLLTPKFFALEKEKLAGIPQADFDAANRESDALLKQQKMLNTDEEYHAIAMFYREISDRLHLGMTDAEIEECAYDRTFNMTNYVPFPDARAVVEAMSRQFRLGVISDTWPSIEAQLDYLGVNGFFSFKTYSFLVGVFKPDERMYLDALSKCGCAAEDTVFIDDNPANLAGAAKLGITPVLIAADPAHDVETPYLKIHALSELL